ncbi:MAG: hypothetical protein PWQ12_218 [Clostridiales bacterium]|jgi:quercetin dioxygenase-like cupin family protein|nr:hypothetical protein [Clostridiales bacterium]
MIVGNFKNLEAAKIMNPAAVNAAMKVLVSPAEGWEGYVMRVIELGEGGHSPEHAHDWPHINYVIEGKGTIRIGDDIHEVEAGGFAYVPANAMHQFSNTGAGDFKFICIVPERGHQ